MTWEWVAFSLIAAILLIFVVASVAQTVQKIAEAKYGAIDRNSDPDATRIPLK
ncbi:hypothetical protein [Pseudoclavibacter sp. RFBB5]|uniref:hypothetical protein n=1 Tax=Pseudoclavibacter sp. RFBB5 TaxID=2080574 RepID=UPI0015E1BE8D|nr:hypothetical protein [Pseudoclavibacter sp. RFBB5]